MNAGYVRSFHYSPHLVSRFTLCVFCGPSDHSSCRDVRLASCLSMPPVYSLGMVSSRRSVQFLQPWKVQLSLRLVYSDRILTPSISSKRPEALGWRGRVFRRPWGRVRFRALVVFHFEITVPGQLHVLPWIYCVTFWILMWFVLQDLPLAKPPQPQVRLSCIVTQGKGRGEAGYVRSFHYSPRLVSRLTLCISRSPRDHWSCRDVRLASCLSITPV